MRFNFENGKINWGQRCEEYVMKNNLLFRKTEAFFIAIKNKKLSGRRIIMIAL